MNELQTLTLLRGLATACLVTTLASPAWATPTASRPFPYPNYQVGGTGTLIVTTDPPQPHADVYMFRYRNGEPEGHQPTLLGPTDEWGRFEIIDHVVTASMVGTYTNERYAVGHPHSAQSNVLNFSIHAATAPTVNRPAPFPHYEVGDSGTLTITTNPPQPDQPIYRWRLKDGQPDDQQPLHVANTDLNGNYTVTVGITPNTVGSYTHERYAVGTPGSPRSHGLNFTITQIIEAPMVERPAPFPNYQVGDSATLTITTDPPQPDQSIYRWLVKDGVPVGNQPTEIYQTDSTGAFSVTIETPASLVGSYSQEQYTVGSPFGPRSPALSFTVEAPPAAPIVARAAPFPNYQVSGAATLTITTDPPQPHEPIYRWLVKDGVAVGDQPTQMDLTDHNGAYSVTVDPIPADFVGTYSQEQYAVGDIDGLRSPALGFTVTALPLGEPTFESIVPNTVDTGAVTVVTLTGTNFTPDSAVRLDDGQGNASDGAKSAPALADVLAIVQSVSADGTQMQVEVDTTQSSIDDFFTLITVDNGLGEAAQAFRIQGTGPIVDALMPPKPRRNETFVFSVMGNNLEHATVTPPAGVTIQIQQRTPEQLTGLLTVAANAPIGPQTLAVHSNGQTTTATFTIFLAQPPGQQEEDLLKGTAIAQRARDAGQPPPTLFMQEAAFSERFVEKIGAVREPLAKGIGCAYLSGHWPIFSDTFQVMVTFDPSTGIIGPIATTLGLGGTVAVRAYTFSISLAIDFFFEWFYCPGSGFSSFVGCFQLDIQAEVPGGRWERFFKNCFGDNEDEAGPSEGLSTRIEFLGNGCVQAENELIEPGVPGFIEGTITQTDCCAGSVALESEGISFGEPYYFDLPNTVETTPDGCTNCEIRELSFQSDIRMREAEHAGLGGARDIEDPVWIAGDEGTVERSDPVAYAGGKKPKVVATFAVDPPPDSSMTGVLRGTGPSGIVFEKQITIDAHATEHTATIESPTAFDTITKHYQDFEIEWTISFDGASSQHAGGTANEMYVTLGELPNNLDAYFRTVFTTGVIEGLSNAADVVEHVWGQFSQQGQPADVTNWFGLPLIYYQPDLAFGFCSSSLSDLFTGSGGSRCGAFTKFLKRTLEVHGIASTLVNVRVRGEFVNQDNPQKGMLIKDWLYGKPSFPKEPQYQWYIDLVEEFGGLLGMVPPRPAGVYGNMISLEGIPGQNSPTPSEKFFFDHQILRIDDEAIANRFGGDCYLDPSYGLSYYGEYDFELTSVAAYTKAVSGMPRYRHLVREPSFQPGAPGVEFDDGIGHCLFNSQP